MVRLSPLHASTGTPRKTSPWVYVGVGCASLLATAVVAAAMLGFWGVRKARQLEQELKDPATRATRARAILGAETLPEGYHTVTALSIPYVMDLAVLSDKEPDAEGVVHGFGRWGFVYVAVLSLGRDEQELRDYFEGRSDDAGVLERNQIRIRAREVIRRGVMSLPQAELMYLAQRSEVSLGEGQVDGVMSMMLVQCPGDRRMRMAFWSGPDPAPDQPVAATDFSGTPADESAMRRMMSHFRPCPR
jgi:hypothetical protein